MDEELNREIKKIALQNATEHDGKTTEKIIISKLLASRADLRSKIKELMQDVSSIVSQVNQKSLQEQKTELDEEFPDALKQKEKKPEERSPLPPLNDAKHGSVITRFPPEPNGYPHIGHAKAAIINQEYVIMHGGKRILRMDDTNPENERLEYYAAIKVGLEWLGIKYDTVKNTSDDIEILYKKCAELIDLGRAYVCTCKREEISRNRREKKSCKCSQADAEEIKKSWDKMFEKYKEGEAIVRFRGDMNSENTVMRDPILFRIIDEKHPLLGSKYRVWPSYDFAVSIEDSLDGVTHAFRSKEYELRNELYYAILDVLNMRKPRVIEFSRLEFKGMPISKRILKPLIEEGRVSWYDDPRLPTLEGLKRRGIKPEAIRKFILSLGFTKSDTLAPFDALESFNRKFVDADSIRLHMVKKPVSLLVNNIPFSSIEISNHPTKDRGKRRVEISNDLLIEEDDQARLREGDRIRLIGLGNVTITKTSPKIESEFITDNAKQSDKKIHWVSKKNLHKIKLLIPHPLFIDDRFNENSLEEVEVYTEPYYLELEEGEEIQFVRFGYCRKDSQNQAVFTHK
ncbi:MAG: glutamate--tRNA ligase [Nitrosopumilaceae archaeon]|nr:glutamate--tRNA ligase [Nitrosopumilaceae archaeon]NIU00494.1 glutamate--tRNA ligase [Nitrosopumilaceae archaeon]NIU86877.1 glutamate--tRNA ligase [Nitrosopumilaceae archaeon]NIV65557.1 glutamate--tRNA ligase [Nitrosopumilaceae archaeon]NIX61096.1 glutamate--tRNA ligase [Nitrosopumilaceae archaeon]